MQQDVKILAVLHIVLSSPGILAGLIAMAVFGGLARCVGVSFYRSLDEQALLTSAAQVFNERGESVIVRGENAIVSKEDRQPYLPAPQAEALLLNALNVYRETHRTSPAPHCYAQKLAV